MYFVLFGLVYRPAMLRLLLPCCASPPAAFLARPAEGDTRPKARGKRSPPVGQRRVSQADGMDAVTGRSAPSSGMSADNEGELFDVVDENNQVVGESTCRADLGLPPGGGGLLGKEAPPPPASPNWPSPSHCCRPGAAIRSARQGTSSPSGLLLRVQQRRGAAPPAAIARVGRPPQGCLLPLCNRTVCISIRPRNFIMSPSHGAAPFFPSRKKIGPGQWDLSCAEHLQPGESYREVSGPDPDLV